jgi:hypothetical protein
VRKHDLLIQENHGAVYDLQGVVSQGVSGLGADIHVMRDDGFHFRNLPWGRDEKEACQGHQCWRGRSDWAITSTGTPQGAHGLVESQAVPFVDHVGLHAAGGIRNHLSREFSTPGFCHFATDSEGKSFISDAGPHDARQYLIYAALGDPGQDALRDPAYLMCPQASCSRGRHSHPFLSPDGCTAFFNSDESGTMQAYMLCNLPPLGDI